MILILSENAAALGQTQTSITGVASVNGPANTTTATAVVSHAITAVAADTNTHTAPDGQASIADNHPIMPTSPTNLDGLFAAGFPGSQPNFIPTIDDPAAMLPFFSMDFSALNELMAFNGDLTLPVPHATAADAGFPGLTNDLGSDPNGFIDDLLLFQMADGIGVVDPLMDTCANTSFTAMLNDLDLLPLPGPIT